MGFWSQLPHSFLFSLLGHLSSLTETLHFAQVCHNWRVFFCRFLRFFFILSEPPLLLPLSDDPIFLGRITNPQSWYRTQIPAGARMGNLWLGSSYGHLLYIRRNFSRTKCRVIISDPITGSDVFSPQLPYPRLNYYYGALTAPLSSRDCILFLFHGSEAFFFNRIGAREHQWNSQRLLCPFYGLVKKEIYPYYVAQILSSKIHNKIFVIDEGALRLLEISTVGEAANQELWINVFETDGIDRTLIFDRHRFGPKLVGCGSDIFLILFLQNHMGGKISRIAAYRLDIKESSNRCWIEVREIPGYSIFVDVGGKSSFACHHPHRWGGQSSCVYLAGPGCSSWKVFPIGSQLIAPHYHLENSPISVESLNDAERWPSCIWVYPTFCYDES